MKYKTVATNQRLFKAGSTFINQSTSKAKIFNDAGA